MVREKSNHDVKTVIKRGTRTITQTWNIEGQQVTQTVFGTIEVTMQDSPRVVNAYDLDSVKVYDLNGVKIEKQRWPDLFANPSLVLVARSEWNYAMEVDPAFLKAARAGVPFVILPQQPRPQAAQAHAPGRNTP